MNFAMKLFRALPQEGNLFFSPTSVQLALARLALGAAGKTKSEILWAIENASVDHDFSDVVEVANSIFYDRNIFLREDYLTMMEKIGGLEIVDFVNFPDDTRKRINAWVAKTTHEKITDLLSPGSIDSRTRVALVNAIYFKADWELAFNPAETQERDFTTENGQIVQVPMMYHENKTFRYFQDDIMQVLLMPYKGCRFARIYFLPNPGVSLQQAEEHVVHLRTEQIMASLQFEPEITVYVPKTKMEWGTESLKLALEQLGIHEAFSDAADFSVMDSGKVSDVFHQACIEDNEKGSVAAAATAVVMKSLAIDPQIIFNANRPFFFSIIDKKTYEHLFLGRYVNP